MAGGADEGRATGPDDGREADPGGDGVVPDAEAALRESEARLRLVTDAMPALISYVDAEERYQFNNRAYEVWFGRSAEELRGRKLSEVLGEAAYEKVRPLARRALAGEAISYELELDYKDGGKRQVEASYVPHRDESGEVRGYFAMVVDVSGRRAAEHALRESEERYRALFETMDEGFCTIEVLFDESGRPHDYRFLEVNRAFERQTGLADAVGRRVRELVPDHEQHWFDLYGRVATTGESTRFEAPAEALGRFYEVHAYRVGPPASRQVAVLFNDLTGRRRDQRRNQFLVELDDALRPLEEPAEITATAARLLAEHLDADRCAYAEVTEDQDAFDVTGDHGRGLPSIVGRYALAEFGADCRRTLRAGETFVVEDAESDPRTAGAREAYRRIGTRAMVCVPLLKRGRFVAGMAVEQARPRHWLEHEIALVQLVAARCWESFERARVLRELRLSEERLRQIAQNVDAVFYVTDVPERRVRYVSPAYERVWGLDARELYADQRSWTDRIHADDRDRVKHEFAAFLAGGPVYSVEYRVRLPDGSVRWVHDRATASSRDVGGAISRVIGIAEDVTERKDGEAELERRARERAILLESERAARMEAERATRLKDDFVATLSHELRTPINAVLGWAQLGRMGALKSEEEVTKAFEVIERNTRVQAQLISDLLDVSRIVTGKLRLEIRTVDPREIVEHALLAVEQTAAEKGVTLERELASDAGSVAGDPARLQQIVWNLLTNALKFTPANGVVRVTLERADDRVRIAVADTGRGIETAFLPHLFERFRQADSSTTRRAGGLGLGLAISKQLVELHGGTIHATSAGLGEGATFVVTLPLAAGRQARRTRVAEGAEPELRAAELVSLEGVRVLVVDDELDARELVERVLVERHAKVVTVGSAGEALDELARELPAVLVSDIGMPEEDGYTLVRRVRALPADAGGTILAIALTAFARAEDRTRALMAGFQAHVTKPVEAEELCATIASLLGRTGRDPG